YIQDTREHIHAQEQPAQHFNVSIEIEEALEQLKTRAKIATITLTTTLDSSIYFTHNPVRLYKVALNLITNALEACERGPKNRERRVDVQFRQETNHYILAVEDSGPGINKADLPHLFQPLYSTKNLPGSGLGLAICKDIMEQEFGGSISVKTSAHGT